MNFNALNTVVATLFIILAVGFLARKVGIIDDAASKKLSKLILMVGQPAMLINSLSSAEYNEENLKVAGFMVIAGFVFHAILAALSFVFAIPTLKNADERKITEFSLMFTNCAFIGFPIFEALLGPQGLFMASFLTISFNVLIWTWGVSIIARGRSDIKLTLKKVLLNFGTVPCAIGFALFALKNPSVGFEMPEFIAKAMQYLHNLCTPISVLVTGALIATQKPKKIFGSWRLYYFNVIKLIVFPIIICLASSLLVKLCGLPQIYAMFFTAAAALPTASSVSMMAENFGIDAGYSSLTVATSSLLAVVTIPLAMTFAGWVFGV